MLSMPWTLLVWMSQRGSIQYLLWLVVPTPEEHILTAKVNELI